MSGADHEELQRVPVNRSGCDPGVVVPEAVVRQARPPDRVAGNGEDDRENDIDRDLAPLRVRRVQFGVAGALDSLFLWFGPQHAPQRRTRA